MEYFLGRDCKFGKEERFLNSVPDAALHNAKLCKMLAPTFMRRYDVSKFSWRAGRLCTLVSTERRYNG